MVTTRSASKGTASPSPSVSGRSGGGRAVRNSGGGRAGAAAAAGSGSGSGSGSGAFTHAPTWATLAWLAVSVPLVVWDSLYVLLRPLTMEGGALHWPLWVPYRLYGEVDHVYGWKAFRARSGFTAAQGSLNVAETALYLAYVAIYYLARAETRQGRGLQQQQQGAAPRAKVLSGRPAAVAVLLAFSSAVMTLSKTVLYCESHFHPFLFL